MSDDLSVIGFDVLNEADYSPYGYMVYNLSTSDVMLSGTDTGINEVHVSKNGRYTSVFLGTPVREVDIWDLTNPVSYKQILYSQEGISHTTAKSNYEVGLTANADNSISRWEYSTAVRTKLLDLGYTNSGTAHVSGLMDDDNWVLLSISDRKYDPIGIYSNSDTTITVQTGEGQSLPPARPLLMEWWNVTDYPVFTSDPNGEIISLTSNDHDTLTVARGQNNTVASAKNLPGKTYKLMPVGPFHGEEVLINTAMPNTVYRFVHHHGVWSNRIDPNYYGSGQFGNISRDGRFVVYASNWDDTDRNDVFIAKAPPFSTSTAAPGSLIIGEFRLRVTNGAADEYFELYNTTGQPLTVRTTDGSSGWALASSDGVTRFTVPNGTVIPANGHYLVANSGGYSLSSYAAPDQTYTGDIPDNSGVALFRTATAANFTTANRLDAVGFSGTSALDYDNDAQVTDETDDPAGRWMGRPARFDFRRRA